jgi:hypothetical protein
VEKYAYLIVAHKDDYTFRTLLAMLDDARNDIYIHMDSKNKDYKEQDISLKYSKVYHTKRTNITWGAYSLINAELILLKMATSNGMYHHYHLISGSDLPIKSQDDIIRFFDNNEDKEFIHFDSLQYWGYRTMYYHILQEYIGRKRFNLAWLVQKIFVRFQGLLHIYRNSNISFYKGSNWWSITDTFARYVISREGWIKKIFKNTYCGDEFVVQTIIADSPYWFNIYKTDDEKTCSNMRLINWEKGKCCTLEIKDYDLIMDSDMMFARKFDDRVDGEIISIIYRKFI